MVKRAVPLKTFGAPSTLSPRDRSRYQPRDPAGAPPEDYVEYQALLSRIDALYSEYLTLESDPGAG